MGLTIYTIDQAAEWDSIVCSFQNYDVYWLSGYVKAFQLYGDGVPLLFYYVDAETRGINVVMKRDVSEDSLFKGKIPMDTFWDFSSPYGYGGWIIEGDRTENLIEEYSLWCKKNGIICEFVRFHPVLENHRMMENSYDVIPLGNTICMDISSPDIIWDNITSKNRNMIRKALKNGVKIYNGRYPEIYETFRKIYNSTMDKNNADSYYYFGKEFYDSILNDLPRNAQVFFAEYEGTIIAASIMLTTNGKMNYHLSGSLKEYSSYAPINLLLYEAALWGYENGCKTLYLGGGIGSGEDSLFSFKKSFYRKDDLKRFYIGKKIFIQDRYEQLKKIRNIDTNSFFPEYRG